MAYSRGLAHSVLVLTLLIWSFSFLAAARLRPDLGLADAVAARFLPVLLGAGALLWLRRPQRVPRAAWWRVGAMGLLGVPVYNFAFLHGLKTVPTGTAALVIALNPVFTAVLARVFLKEAFGLRRTIGLVLALAGVFVVIRGGDRAPRAARRLDARLGGPRMNSRVLRGAAFVGQHVGY